MSGWGTAAFPRLLGDGMIATWKWPDSAQNLDFTGDRRGLFGMLLLPELQRQRVHLLRFAEEGPADYAALSLTQLQELPGLADRLDSQPRRSAEPAWWWRGSPPSDRGLRRTLPDGGRLSVSPSADKLWSWQLRDAQGVELDSGTFATEHATEIHDAILTPHQLLVVATDYTSVSTAHDISPTHRAGIAARRPRARLHWLHADPVKRLALEHAHEERALVCADLSFPDPGARRSLRLVRWTIDPRTLDYNPEDLYPRGLLAFELEPARGEGGWRHLFGVTADLGDEIPSLIRLDRASRRSRARSFSFAREPSAPLWIGAPSGGACLIVCVYDAVRDSSEVLLLDPERIEAPPLASIELPDAVRCDERPRFISTSI